jgi:hypothetical protein
MSISATSMIQPSVSPDTLVPTLASENAATASAHLHMLESDDDGLSFSDVLDVINPLQHIPIVNDIYRELTGDKIGVGARLIGGTLYGGPVGLIGAAFNAVLEESTGHDAGGHLIALFKGEDGTPSDAATTQLAKATPTTPSPAIDKPEDITVAKPLILPDMAGLDAEPPPPQAAALAVIAAKPNPAAADPSQAAAEQSQTTATAQTQAALAPTTQVAAAEGRPMPLMTGRQQRLLPTPARNTPIATRSPPALGVAVSESSARSNTPVTGARPNRLNVTPAMAQQMMADQANNQAASSASNDWFAAAMAQGLAKYDASARLGSQAIQ